jgi:hypothetical protein
MELANRWRVVSDVSDFSEAADLVRNLEGDLRAEFVRGVRFENVEAPGEALECNVALNAALRMNANGIYSLTFAKDSQQSNVLDIAPAGA